MKAHRRNSAAFRRKLWDAFHFWTGALGGLHSQASMSEKQELLKLLETLSQGSQDSLLQSICYKFNKSKTNFTLSAAIDALGYDDHLCLLTGEIGYFISSYQCIPIKKELRELAQRLQLAAKTRELSPDEIERLSGGFSEESCEAINLICALCDFAQVSKSSGRDWLQNLVSSKQIVTFVRTLQEVCVNVKPYGFSKTQMEWLWSLLKLIDSYSFGKVLLKQAMLVKPSARLAPDNFGNSKSKRRLVEAKNALTELAELTEKSIPELRTHLRDADLVAALKEKVPALLGNKDLSAVLASLSTEWSHLAKAIIDIIRDTTLFNYDENVQSLKSAIDMVKKSVDLPELLCWGEPNEAKRKRFVYENLFKEGMVDPLDFFSIVGENSALAQPKKFNTIDPEHMESMFDKFITKVKEHPKIFEEMLKKSSRAAPLAAIEHALLPPLEVNVAELEMPKLPAIKEFDFRTVFDELADHFKNSKDLADEFVKTMNIWKEKDLFATSTRQDLIDTLCSVLYGTVDHVDMTPIMLLLSQFEANGITNYDEQ
jgi:hypothetical protein